MSHILIAEDEPRIAQFVESGLRAAGHLTTIAADGETALLLARSGAVSYTHLDVYKRQGPAPWTWSFSTSGCRGWTDWRC